MINQKFRKLISIVTAMACICTFGATAYASKIVDEVTGKYDLSIDFEDGSLTTGSTLEDITSYFYNNVNLLGSFDNPGYIFENFGDSNSSIEITEDASFGKSAKITSNYYYGSAVSLFRSPANSTDNISVAFSVNNTNTSKFGCQIDGAGQARAVDFEANSVMLFGEIVQSYDLNTWYDVKLDYVIGTNMSRLSIKKSSESNWNVYTAEIQGDYATYLASGYNRVKIGAGDWGNGAVSYIDNIKVSTTNAPESIEVIEPEAPEFDINVDFEETAFTTSMSIDDIEAALKQRFSTDSVFENCGTGKTNVSIVNDSDSGKCLKMQINWWSGSSMFIYNGSLVKKNVSVLFSVKNENSAAFGLQFDNNQNGRVVSFEGNSVSFFGTNVQSYELNTWYDVRVDFVPSTLTAALSIKKSSDTNWNVYKVMLGGDFASDLANGYKKIRIGSSDWKHDAISYVDNIKLTFDNAPSSIVPVFYESDFNTPDSFSYYRPQFGEQYVSNKWAFENCYLSTDSSVDAVTAGIKELEDYGNVLAIKNLGLEYKNTTLSLYPFGDSAQASIPDATHHISFKLGYDNNKTSTQVVLMDNEAAQEPTYCRPVAINDQGQVLLNDVVVEGVKVLPNELYDVEIIANKEGLNKVVFNDLDGSQYISNLTLGEGGLPYCMYFFAPTATESEIYVDDFKWDMYFGDEFNAGDITLVSGYDKAALDENVKIALDETADLSLVNVVIKKNGEVATPDYKLVSAKNAMIVAFNSLETSSEYEVTVSNIKNLAGTTAENKSITFTTQDFNYNVGVPKIAADNTVSVSASSAYYKTASLYIIVAAYDATGAISNVEQKVINPTSLENEIFTFKPSFTNASKVKAFVWSDFNSMIPFTTSVTK